MRVQALRLHAIQAIKNDARVMFACDCLCKGFRVEETGGPSVIKLWMRD